MPKNSYVVSIDREATIHEAMELLMNEGYEELLLWDKINTKWILLFSLADAIRFTLFAMQSLVKEKEVSNVSSLRSICQESVSQTV
jgi:hypothetical protein